MREKDIESVRKVRRVESWLGAFGQFVRATNSDYLATFVSNCFVLKSYIHRSYDCEITVMVEDLQLIDITCVLMLASAVEFDGII